jgi:hypothetical protein
VLVRCGSRVHCEDDDGGQIAIDVQIPSVFNDKISLENYIKNQYK